MAGIVSPLSSSGLPGEPGWMSKNRLPSKKMRGRTLMRASRWIGSASSFSFIVTVTAGDSPPTGSTFETWPTSTPAIRTACFFWIGGALVKRAFSSKVRVKGMSFVNARKTAIRIRTRAISPT